jgi:predicted RNase H-like HicB family nuclease
MGTLHLTAVIWPEGQRYVSRCPEIGVASFGETPAAARAALQEAVELWIANARELGLLDEIRASLETDERYTTSLEVAV